MSAPTAEELLPLPDAGALEHAAAACRAVGERPVDAVADVARTWRALGSPGVYETPQTDVVLTAMAGPVRIADVVRTQCRDVAAALDAYAANLQVLAATRSKLVEALGAEAAAEAQVQLGTDASTEQRMQRQADADHALRLRILDFNDAAQRADADCAAALRAVRAFPAARLEHDVQEVERGNQGVSDVLEKAAERVRRVPVLHVTDDAPDDLPQGVRPRYLWDGEVYVPSPSDPRTLIPLKSLSGLDRPSRFFAVLEEDAAESGVMPIAKGLGRFLGIAGIGLTAASLFAERDEELKELRPDMSPSERLQEDLRTTVAVGLPAVGGSLIGAAVMPEVIGLAGGAAGSEVPVVGNIAGAGIGAIVGAIAGGVLGGWAGESAGRALDRSREEAVDHGADHAPAYRRAAEPATP